MENMSKQFKKVIIWGHKLFDARTANTFAFIHDSWFRTFKHMGYEVAWLDNSDEINLNKFDFENCLFLTEGQVDQEIPIVASSKYIIHNCNIEKYKPILPNVLNLQVYTHDCLSRKVEVIDKEQLCYYQAEPDYSRPDHGCDNRTIYQPWATNLLPNEFSAENNHSTRRKGPVIPNIFWVGSIMGGPHRNDDKIQELIEAAKEKNIRFVHAKLQNDMQPEAIASSWISPAIQGQWQVEKGYVPCRVFKNLSYGRMAATNSETVYNLFDKKLVYDPNIKTLVQKAFDWEINPENKKTLDELIEKVRTKHTFVNRIENMLKVL